MSTEQRRRLLAEKLDFFRFAPRPTRCQYWGRKCSEPTHPDVRETNLCKRHYEQHKHWIEDAKQ